MQPEQTSSPVGIVEIRPAHEDDLAMLYTFEADPLAAEMAGMKVRDEAAFRAQWSRMLASDSVIEYAVLADGVLAGSIGCFRMDGTWELGYWIGRAFWNKRVATRALKQLLDLVGHRPLCARVVDQNAASIRMLERNGFVKIAESDEPESDRFLAARLLTYRLD